MLAMTSAIQGIWGRSLGGVAGRSRPVIARDEAIHDDVCCGGFSLRKRASSMSWILAAQAFVER